MITADHYIATTQAISDAIDRSIRHDEIVRIECLRASTHEAICRALAGQCEGTDGDGDYWGTRDDDDDDDGESPWRVRVLPPRGAVR